MKIIKLEFKELDSQEKERLNDTVYICESNECFQKELDVFKARFGISSSNDTQGVEFLCVLPLQEQDKIVGVVRVAPNDVRTQFPLEPDKEEQLYHEYVSIVLYEELFNSTFLHKCFTYTIKHSIEIEKEKPEIFWYSYNGGLVAQVVDCYTLNKVKDVFVYYFTNQATYLTEPLMNEIKREIAHDETIVADLNADPELMTAATHVVEYQLGAVSFLQRKMKIGYCRASRIMDQLEELGIVSRHKENEGREVKVKTVEEFSAVFEKIGLL